MLLDVLSAMWLHTFVLVLVLVLVLREAKPQATMQECKRHEQNKPRGRCPRWHSSEPQVHLSPFLPDNTNRPLLL